MVLNHTSCETGSPRSVNEQTSPAGLVTDPKVIFSQPGPGGWAVATTGVAATRAVAAATAVNRWRFLMRCSVQVVLGHRHRFGSGLNLATASRQDGEAYQTMRIADPPAPSTTSIRDGRPGPWRPREQPPGPR